MHCDKCLSTNNTSLFVDGDKRKVWYCEKCVYLAPGYISMCCGLWYHLCHNNKLTHIIDDYNKCIVEKGFCLVYKLCGWCETTPILRSKSLCFHCCSFGKIYIQKSLPPISPSLIKIMISYLG